MLLNAILLLAILLIIFFLGRHLRKSYQEKVTIPVCKFNITNPEFHIEDSTKTAKFRVYTKIRDRYFRDFPIGFKFYSTDRFRTKIKIVYNSTGDDEEEIIYDRIVEFEDNAKYHIYYINDVIVGSIDIVIETNSFYGKPTVLFEILQNNMCDLQKEHKMEIAFPE